MVYQNIFAVIMTQGLLPKNFLVEFPVLKLKLLTLHWITPGRMALVKALMASLEIAFYMGG